MKIINKTTKSMGFTIQNESGVLLSGSVQPNQFVEYKAPVVPVVSGVVNTLVLKANDEVLRVSNDTTATFVTDLRTGILA